MSKSNGAIGFEDKLWKAADKLRGNMDSAEYKHIVLGLIFLKYISDAFDAQRKKIKEDYGDDEDTLEDRDYYKMDNVFWVPKDARWSKIHEKSKNSKIGEIIDNAMEAIEKENRSLKGVLPKRYARRDLDKRRLGGVIDLISDIDLRENGDKSKDVLGQVYEFFLGKFAQQEGKGGGEFFTPSSIVKLLVEMIEPYKGRVYDPCCGSGGMFVQSEKFVEAHGGTLGDIAIYGQESNPTTWKMAKMNLAIRGIDADLGKQPADSFTNDLHPSLKADYILANPPFNDSDWGKEVLEEDQRWKYGLPPKNNANYAWIQHFIHHLSPKGIAGFVLANGSLTTQTSGESEIRKSIVKEGLIDCIISLPSQLFLTTQIPASLWFINRNKSDRTQNKVLFIDCRDFGTLIDRTTRELSPKEISKISKTYHNWKSNGEYKDISGFVKEVDISEIEKNDFALTPGRYVGIRDVSIEDETSFQEKFKQLKSELHSQIDRSRQLDDKIINSMEEMLVDGTLE